MSDNHNQQVIDKMPTKRAERLGLKQSPSVGFIPSPVCNICKGMKTDYMGAQCRYCDGTGEES